MFRKLSESIANLLITNNIVADENRDAYIYGLELLFPQILFWNIGHSDFYKYNTKLFLPI